MSSDYKAMDMPTHLGRSVLIQDPADPSKWIPDASWYEETRKVHQSLLDFYKSEGLLRHEVKGQIEDMVLMYSEFTEVGQRLLKSGAIDRWLQSFDKPGQKKDPKNVSSLRRALALLRRNMGITVTVH